LFPQARQVIVANSFHVTALYDADGCASTLVRRFVATLDAGDTTCAAAVPAYRLLPAFARRAAELAVPRPAAGNQGSTADLQHAAAAVHAAADALARWWVNYDGDGVGLRGGRFSYRSAGSITAFTLDRLRWTDDVAVSGELDWSSVDQRVRARLQLAGGTLQAEWPARGSGAVATFDGAIGGRRIAATMPAP
jgi:hypothetical protein